MSFNDVPDPILGEIFQYFDVKTLGIICRVCKRFKDAAEQDQIWDSFLLPSWKTSLSSSSSKKDTYKSIKKDVIHSNLFLTLKNKDLKGFKTLLFPLSFKSPILDLPEPVKLRTVLHDACYDKNKEAVFLLLEKGANPNLQTYGKNVPLHFASWNGSLEIVEALLKYGAKKDIKDINNHLPIDDAKSQNHTQIIKLLSKKQ